MSNKNKAAIIVKKIKKGGGGRHHGGSWKVAYADFVTAMMAFFLLMWLLNMTSEEKRARLTMYFKNFSIYDSGGTSWMDKSSEIFSESGESSQKAMSEKQSTTISNMQDMEQELKAGMMDKLGDAKDQVMVDTVEGGVRIQMTDKDGSLMFETGNNKLTPKAKEVLRIIGNQIKALPNKVAIEGHTDAVPYARNDYSNWELSTERASSARKELEANGLKTERIERVSGLADKDPLIAENPADPRNRRISIILKMPDNPSRPAGNSPAPAEHITGEDHVIRKFDESISLVKGGANAGSKAEDPTPQHNENTGVKAKETAETAKNDWGAVIKKEEWTPVIKEGLNPVIKNADRKTKIEAAPQHDDAGSAPKYNWATKDALKPAAGTSDKDASAKKKKEESTAVQKSGQHPLEKRPVIIEELRSPVISKDDLFQK
ncbi:MAG: hypothetical protein C4560_13800 [Nitrospiraceae bacterium]|nr:MAG: hypothetical protein C4560_13800 [Nitrospiraceae bacterium]